MNKKEIKAIADRFNFKIKKVKGLKDVIKSQEEFIEQVNLTLTFLKIYSGNPSDFKLLFNSKVWEFYRFEESIDNPEFMWESIDEMAYDMINGEKKFDITSNGIFSVIVFSKSMKKDFWKKFNEQLKPYSDGEWYI